MAKQKTQKQVRFLFSKGSPLTPEQKKKLEGELHSGTVKIKKSGKKK
jgi:hypothetical protein